MLSNRAQRLNAAVSVLFAIAAGAAVWALVALVGVRKANAHLELELQTDRRTLAQAVEALRQELVGDDGPLAVRAANQLTAIHGKSLDQIISWIPETTLQNNIKIATFALALDLRDADGGPGEGNFSSRFRDELRRAMSRARAMKTPPPSPGEEVQLNRRLQINGGRFIMGSPAGEPYSRYQQLHAVTVSPFVIQTHEVTNREYWRFDPQHDASDQPDFPVANVTWHDAMAYAFWVGGGLPSEAQWEFAARGTSPQSGRRYPWGNDPPDASRSVDGGDIAPVGSKPAGRTPQTQLDDLAGNVWEWCRDWYGPYGSDDLTNPTGHPNGIERVVRGGSFLLNPDSLRGAFRYMYVPDYRGYNVGFRVVSSR